MKISVCIPLYDRLTYLPAVLAGVDAMADRDGVDVIFAMSPHAVCAAPCDTPNRMMRVSIDDVNASIVESFDAAFEAGADVAVYLADDCVPSPDFIRISRVMAGMDGQIAFGLWWPTCAAAEKYVDLIVLRRGCVWPAKSFGCNRAQWEALAPVLRDSYGKGTYDCVLAEHLWKTRGRILCPIVPRVKDIGRIGSYDSPEVWDKYFSWIIAAPEYRGDYIILSE